MRGFIEALLVCSVSMSVIAVLYMAAGPLLTRRCEKGRYYAWLAVLFGFVIPFRPRVGGALVSIELPNIGQATGIPAPWRAVPQAAQIQPPLASAMPGVEWWSVVFIIWLAGAVFFLAHHAVKYYRFMKTAERLSREITARPPLELLESAKSELGISRRIGLYECAGIVSPMMTGFLKPRVFLPKTDYHNELPLILRHELVHYKRRDLLYKLFVLAAAAVHWFNPIVHIMARAINIQCELACDAETLRGADADTRRRYGETILGTAKYRTATALSTNFNGGKKIMKKRIISILDTRRKKAGAVVICAVILAVIGAGIVFSTAGPDTAGTGDYPLFTWSDAFGTGRGPSYEERHLRMRLAAQGEIEHALMTIEGITHAIVTLHIPMVRDGLLVFSIEPNHDFIHGTERAVAIATTDPAASAVINTTREFTNEEARNLALLISRAVEALELENIVIINHYAETIFPTEE